MKLYQFSPITDEKTSLKALEYIHTELRKLAGMVLEERLPIKTLKIFAHYEDEYKFLLEWINSIGVKNDESSQTSYYVKPNKPIDIAGEPIEYLGIRVPDPHRLQVGCGDFVVDNFEHYKQKYIGRSEFIREVNHSRYKMLELFHPDIEVLGYIVKDD